MSVYLDTSAITAALTQETQTARMQAWLGEQAIGALFISEWVVTEFSSALAKKHRMKELTSEKYAETLKTWRSLREISFNILPVTTAHFKAAAALLDATDLNLRAGDALHLAIAADHKLRLLTLDTRMAEAAEAIGVAVAV
ncbi:type II toxin-antitoxin system VapC family toxin [Novosphingopyxis sp.]|uniref:type II toxin-antitoxin system VapC family toxin n=1 Tax=Novosphingopyxis sp. TaxID=2709690 RepID=UPI003B59D3F0